MTRREISWRLEMAAEKMKRRGLRVGNSNPVQRNSEFTEEESKKLDQELDQSLQSLKARFQPKG